jgi:nucleotide-binding universal stress UspA family protein
MTKNAESKIVVGVDGSESSIGALKWAARQAELTGATLHVVTAWAFPEEPTPFEIVPHLPLGPDRLAEPREELDKTIVAVLGSHPSITVIPEVRSGHVVPVLLDAARDADLLVVGSRGRGAFAGMLLGSVSEHCVHHARCPVLVVRSIKD